MKESVSCSAVSNSFATPWTVPRQAPLSMGFPRQEYWSGLPFPSPGDPPHPGIKTRFPTLQADSLLSELPGNPINPQDPYKTHRYTPVSLSINSFCISSQQAFMENLSNCTTFEYKLKHFSKGMIIFKPLGRTPNPVKGTKVLGYKPEP